MAGTGKGDELKGRAKQAFGAATDDEDLEHEGEVDETSGKVKGKIDELGDKLSDAVDSVKKKLT